MISTFLIEASNVPFDMADKLLLVREVGFPYQGTITKHPHDRVTRLCEKNFLMSTITVYLACELCLVSRKRSFFNVATYFDGYIRKLWPMIRMARCAFSQENIGEHNLPWSVSLNAIYIICIHTHTHIWELCTFVRQNAAHAAIRRIRFLIVRDDKMILMHSFKI